MYIIDRVISCILNICLIKIAIIAYPPMVYSTDILGQFFGTLPLSRHYKGSWPVFLRVMELRACGSHPTLSNDENGRDIIMMNLPDSDVDESWLTSLFSHWKA